MGNYARINPSGKQVVFQFRMPPEMKEKFRELCQELKINGAELLRGYVEQFIRETEMKKEWDKYVEEHPEEFEEFEENDASVTSEEEMREAIDYMEKHPEEFFISPEDFAEQQEEWKKYQKEHPEEFE